jgi:orotate phosphoribosyltransferase
MNVLHELDRAGAVLLDRHFVYTSGKHGSGYINMDPIFPDLYVLSGFCRGLGKPFRDDDVAVIAGAATGGIPLAVLTALGLSGGNPALAPAAVWADKTDEGFAFERAGFAGRLANERVLVVEDLLTTGGSVIKVCREAEKHGAKIVGVSVIVNRGGLSAKQLGVPRLESLASVSFQAVDADVCELCRDHVPIVEDVGHGSNYRNTHPDYPGGYIKLLA